MTKIKALVAVLAVVSIVAAAHSAYAITSAQRVAVLRYNQCMATVRIQALCSHYLPGH